MPFQAKATSNSRKIHFPQVRPMPRGANQGICDRIARTCNCGGFLEEDLLVCEMTSHSTQKKLPTERNLTLQLILLPQWK